MSVKPVIPPRPKYYKQPKLTADTSAEEDIICIDSTSEPKHSQARQVHTKLNLESTLKNITKYWYKQKYTLIRMEYPLGHLHVQISSIIREWNVNAYKDED